MKLASLFAVLVLTGCTKTSPLFCDEDTPCTDPERPVCDLTGDHPASEGHANTCVPRAPDPDGGVDPSVCEGEGASVLCADDAVVQCSSVGEVLDEQPCPLGCEPDPARCFELAPSNDLEPFFDNAATAPAIDLADGAVVDTSTGVARNADGGSVNIPSVLVPAMDGGVATRVLVASSARLGDVRFEGEPAVALLVLGEVEIEGELSFSGALVVDEDGKWVQPPTPGAVEEGRETCRGDWGVECGGGAGGGHGSAGGLGGATSNNPPALGGATTGADDLQPLVGGCPGGTAIATQPLELNMATALGGNGGGAIQISSRTSIAIGASAGINASGFGGVDELPGNRCGGAGGGSGGAILLEAPVVRFAASGQLAANGGGGGCMGAAGGDGRMGATPAAGGSCAAHGNGGSGAALEAPPGAGDSSSDGNGGGGGGGVGRIRINAGVIDGLEEAVISPGPSLGEPGRR